MKSFLALAATILFVQTSISQSVVNGNFNSGSTGWGCSPETNPQSTYGGVGSNTVAEVDASAGLCQTISGFTIGSVYTLTFQCSRRTTCGPTIQTMNVNINNGALNTTVSRNGTGWNLANETFTFTATSTSHLLRFTGTSAGTCGLIVDNISISIFSNLATSFIDFQATTSDNRTFQFDWFTATEENNDYFILEESQNGTDWKQFETVKSQGDSETHQSYSTSETFAIVPKYVRLSIKDNNGEIEHLKTIYLLDDSSTSEIKYWPNAVENYLNITQKNIDTADVQIVDMYGNIQKTSTNTLFISKDQIAINLSDLSPGMYFLWYKSKSYAIIKK